MAAHVIDLEPGEVIEYEVRRHMFVFYARLAFILFLMLLPLFGAGLLSKAFNTIFVDRGILVFFVFYSFWTLILTIFFFFRWTDYYLDVWVITNKRVFDVEQKGMFNRSMSTFLLKNIQDINVDISGILPTFLKYGDVHVHTAGESTNFIIRDASEPLEVKKKIMEIYEKQYARQEELTHAHHPTPLEQEIAKQHNTHQ